MADIVDPRTGQTLLKDVSSGAGATYAPAMVPVDASGAVITGGGTSGAAVALLDGTLTATTVAAALPAHSAIGLVSVQNDPTSTSDIYVGNATSQSARLQPGQEKVYSLANTNLLSVRSASGTATVNWQAL